MLRYLVLQEHFSTWSQRKLYVVSRILGLEDFEEMY
jgi:hypothetical protein